MRTTLGEWSAMVLSVLVSAAALGPGERDDLRGRPDQLRARAAISRCSVISGRWRAARRYTGERIARAGSDRVGARRARYTVARSRQVQTMVDYTAPVFWFFFLLTGMALFILRRQRRRHAAAV